MEVMEVQGLIAKDGGYLPCALPDAADLGNSEL